MNPVFKKLGLSRQNPIAIVNAPEEYIGVMKDIEAEIHTTIEDQYQFIQIFAQNRAQAREVAGRAVEALDGDGYLWFCYPKGTSKKYRSDINRNNTWDIFAPFDFQAVNQISLDEDWCAIRFRSVDYIKTMIRKNAANNKGNEKAKGISRTFDD